MSKVKWVNLIPFPQRHDYSYGSHVVYLVYSPISDLYKIGWSADLRERMKNLQRDQHDIPGPYKLIHTTETDCGRYLERQLHLIFAHRHSIREWYRLARADVRWIVNLGERLPNGIPLRADVVPPLAEWSD